MSSIFFVTLLRFAQKTFVLGLMLCCASSAIALTGGRLVGMINGNEEEKSAAAFVVSAVDSMDEVSFCRPYKFKPEKIFGALEIQLSYNPLFYETTADMLVREVLIKLTPCSKKSKTSCICLNKNNE